MCACACVLLLHVVLGTAQCNFQANYLHQHYVAECQQHCWGSKYIFQMLHVHLARGARCCCLFNFFLFGIATSICGNAVLLHIYMIDQMCAHTHTHSYVHISQFVACVWSASSIVVACCTFRLTNECPPVGVARNTVSVSSVRQRQMSGYAWRATHQIQQQINAFNLFFRYLQRLRLFEIEEIISGATVHRPRRPLSAFVFVVVFLLLLSLSLYASPVAAVNENRSCPLACDWSSSWLDTHSLLSDYSDFTFICMSTNVSAGHCQRNFNFEENLITFIYKSVYTRYVCTRTNIEALITKL